MIVDLGAYYEPGRTRRRRNAVIRKGRCNGEVAHPVEVFVKDTQHNRSGDEVDFKSMQPSAVCSLARVWMWTGIGEAITEGRASPKESAFILGLGSHRRSNANLDAITFTLQHPAVQAHDEVVNPSWIKFPPYFRDPEFDAVMNEKWKLFAELIAGRRPGRVHQSQWRQMHAQLQQWLGSRANASGSPFPWERATLANVKVIDDDDPTLWGNEALCP